MQPAATHPAQCGGSHEQHRDYRVERQFSSPRRIRELVRDLLRAHSGE